MKNLTKNTAKTVLLYDNPPVKHYFSIAIIPIHKSVKPWGTSQNKNK
jgi:hypothetical protein